MLIFIHGGVPGVTPYRSGSHIWGRCLAMFRKEFEALAVDLKGNAVDVQVEEVRSLLKGRKAHLVGHDLGGLVSLAVAMQSPDLVKAVTVVSSVAAAPTGDGVEDTTLAFPPEPKWSRASQAWALERVSYTRHHIDDALLDGCVAAAKVQPQAADDFAFGVTQAKTKFFEACRGAGVRVPVQVVWGSHDPHGAVDQGLWLYRLAAQKQRVAQFHLLQRTGALPFREEPEAFHQVVAAFHEGIG